MSKKHPVKAEEHPLKVEKTPKGWCFQDAITEEVLAEGEVYLVAKEKAAEELERRKIDAARVASETKQTDRVMKWVKTTLTGKLSDRQAKLKSRFEKKVARRGGHEWLRQEMQRDHEMTQRRGEALQGAPVALYIGGMEYRAQDGKIVSTPCDQPPSPQKQRKGLLAYLKIKRNQEQLPAATAGKIAKGTATRQRVRDRDEQLRREGVTKRKSRVKQIAKEEHLKPRYVSQHIE